MHFVSYQRLQLDIVAFAATLPPIQGIIGVPRSGSMVAYKMGLHTHLPTADLDTYLALGGFPEGGRRLKEQPDSSLPILLIDDSAWSGRSMLAAIERLETALPREQFLTAVLYNHPKCPKGRLDLWCKVIPGRRCFEWNIWNKPALMTKTLVDMDGVLCPDPPRERFEEAYVEFITNAPPLYRPQQVQGVVTCRLEKRRPITEAWLSQRELKYGSLTMMQFPTAQARQRKGDLGGWKGEIYAASDALLFVESSKIQAERIREVSKRLVFCVEDMRLA